VALDFVDPEGPLGLTQCPVLGEQLLQLPNGKRPSEELNVYRLVDGVPRRRDFPHVNRFGDRKRDGLRGFHNYSNIT